MAILSGVTYYRRTDRYSNDVTKDCGLTGGEIDDNFYFLRGYDIEEIKWNNIKDELTFKRVNGDVCTISGITSELRNKLSEINTEINTEGTRYDVDTDTFHLVINGIDTLVTGFTECTNTIYTDSSLNGNGKPQTPLMVSETIKTGFHKPCIGFVDTLNGDAFPLTPEIGDCYVSKEKCPGNGLLYNYYSMDAISKILEQNNSEWRIPSVDEWSDMLNAIEDDDTHRNHNSLQSNVDLGEYAGLYLKSRNGEWNEFEGKDFVSTDSYGFNALPSGIAELGEQNFYGRRTSFWTSTVASDNTDVWSKTIDYNKETVHQQAEGRGSMISIRLIKNFTGSYNSSEVILGRPYKIIPMPYINSTETGTKLWTAQNLSYDDINKLKSINNKSEMLLVNTPDTVNNFTYYINSWTGKNWEKMELPNNSIVIIENGPNNVENEEWLISGDGLKRRSDIFTDIVKEKITPEINNISNNINQTVMALENNVKDSIDGVNETLSAKVAFETTIREANDINSDELYEFNVTDGVKLKTNSGKEIVITFNGDFGEF